MRQLKPDEYAMSLDEVSCALNIPIRTVTRIQKSAYNKFKQYCKEHNISFNDLVEGLSK
jgi:hypothetical protein